MNLLKLSLLLGLSVGVINTSMAAQNDASFPRFNNSNPQHLSVPQQSFAQTLKELVDGTSYSASASNSLDILALLTAQQLPTTGVQHTFGKDKKPEENEFELMVSGVHKVMVDFKGNFLWDTFILDKLDQAAPAFQGHLLHLYTMGRYFQERLKRQDPSGIISTIKRECVNRSNYSRVDGFLAKVQEVEKKLGLKATNYAGSKTIALVKESSDFPGGFDTNGAIKPFFKPVLQVNFPWDKPESTDISGFTPESDRFYTSYVVPTKNPSDFNTFMVNKYETKGSLTDRFLITDDKYDRYLIGHIDPSIEGGVDADDKKNIGGRSNTILLSSADVKRGSDAERKINSLSDFLEATSGVPYDLQKLADLQTSHPMPQDLIDQLKPLFPGAAINTHLDAFKVISMGRQGLVSEPPVILSNVNFSGLANYEKRKGVIDVKNPTAKRSQAAIDRDIHNKIVFEKDKAEAAFQKVALAEGGFTDSLEGNAWRGVPRADALKALKIDFLTQLYLTRGNKAFGDVVNAFSIGMIGKDYSTDFRETFIRHCLTELDFIALQKDEGVQKPSVSYLTPQESAQFTAFVTSLAQAKLRTYNVGISSHTVSVLADQPFFAIDNQPKLEGISHITSPGSLAQRVVRNSDVGQTENVYFTINRNEEYYRGGHAPVPDFVDAVLYKEFYTPKIIYRLNTWEWKLYQESQGIPGPDMVAQLQPLLNALNEKYAVQRGQTLITIAQAKV